MSKPIRATLINYNDHTNTGAPMIFAVDDFRTTTSGQIEVSYDDMDDDCTPKFESSLAPDTHTAFIRAFKEQFDIEDYDTFTFFFDAPTQ